MIVRVDKISRRNKYSTTNNYYERIGVGVGVYFCTAIDIRLNHHRLLIILRLTR